MTRSRFFKYQIWILLTVMLATAGCDRREQQSCRMANEYVVAKTATAPSALEVLRLDSTRVAVFWSADGTVSYSVVGNEGIPAAKPMLIEQSTTHQPAPKTFWSRQKNAVLNAVSLSPIRISERLVAVAMLCHQGQNDAMVVTALLDVTAGQVRWIQSIGKTGLFVRTVSLTRKDNVLLVGWQNSHTTPQSIMLKALDIETGKIRGQTHLGDDLAVYGPALQHNKDATIVVWSKVEKVGNRVQLQSASLNGDLSPGAINVLDSLELFDAATNLVPYKDGFAAVYRDNRDGDRTEEFYFTVLDHTGKKRQAAKRISRADGPQGPRISPGDAFFFSSAIRSYNNNYLVGFNRFDRFGTKTGGEFQVYADKCDFVRAGLVTHGDTAVLVYAENADAGGRILASTISCSSTR
ncbi:MAG: hypothetical protein JXR76_13515 [Deltaproteobacteria bacterium]|nr:hypothetical protein [Deltaproteobacteria bacterium]